MDQVIVTLDGKDHKIGYGEHTVCGIPVPHGTPREDGVKECKVCFPKDEEEAAPEAPFSIATPAEELGHYENPDAAEGEAGYVEPEKPASKATKAG